MRRLPSIMVIVLLIACRSTGRPAPRDDTDRAAGVVAAPSPLPAAWSVSAGGMGPIRIGDSLRVIASHLGVADTVPAAWRECSVLRGSGDRRGAAVMIRNGIVARVAVDSVGIATADGIAIGSTHGDVMRSYAGRVTEHPHKYTDGRYLVVTPAGPDSSGFRIVFETDGERVLRYRAGRLPEAEWVEGCG